MSLIRTLHGGATGEAVQIPDRVFIQVGYDKPCHAGVKFDADGDIYSKQANGGWSKVATWLLVGGSGDFYLSRVIDSGSLDTDAGAGPLLMSTDREYSLEDGIFGGLEDGESAQVSFEISTDVSGSPVAAANSYNIAAVLL
ncbi:unnamed protein product [marine sediment metagenome]|uniref:Uncharacterized protein n=1 Tax=marine sediment metagenome TaxID=412755 RepID=X0RY39_9ZZZZ